MSQLVCPCLPAVQGSNQGGNCRAGLPEEGACHLRVSSLCVRGMEGESHVSTGEDVICPPARLVLAPGE
jgi:hypothetical protein